MLDYKHLIKEWKSDFIEKARRISGSRKQKFSYTDALFHSVRIRNDYDTVLITYLDFIYNSPLKNNDYYKYTNSYRKGKKLNLKYFRHDKSKLEQYYSKIDNNPDYDPFNIDAYEGYVLFMMFKLYGVYKEGYDTLFNVKKIENRIYNPLSNIPSVLRGELPMRVKEYDISQAYPTFIDIDLDIKHRKQDVYSVLDKKTFNTLINMHKDIKGADLQDVRAQLAPIYNSRVSEVLTEQRFNTKGQMFRDLSVHEEKYINDFVAANNITNYARLHDGVFVLSDVECKFLNFGAVKFHIKNCIKPILHSVPTNFYYHQGKNLITSPKQYADFFAQEKIIRGREDNNDKLIIFKDTNNVASPFNYKTETVEFLKENINEIDTNEIENRIAKENTTKINQGFFLLPSKPIIFYTDNSNSFGLSFKNGFVRYNKETPTDLEFMKYGDVQGFFAPHRTQNHNFTKNDKTSVFETFLAMVSTGKDPRIDKLSALEKETFNSFCSMFGYMCHSYKNPAFNPAIILSDYGANNTNRNGGRGKTVFVNALQHIQPSIIKGGNEFNPTYIHNFADLTNDKRIYILDDVPAGFDYDALYTNIVGGINCQRKNKEAIQIPFDKAPKFIITTNWAVRYDPAETSTNRRFFEYKFTDFFNQENTPQDVFQHSIFDEWDKNEWNLFYSFTFKCVQLYLEKKLRRIKYDKSEDNFRAYFNNDTVHNEFERVFQTLLNNSKEFIASDFLSNYNHFENPMRHEKLFHTKNIKKLIDAYIKHHNLNIRYVQSSRKWINDDYSLRNLPFL